MELVQIETKLSNIDEYPIIDSSNLIDSNAVAIHGSAFDITEYHKLDDTSTYLNLSEALGTAGANIPEDARHGGMTVKFVQSSDNKYVQYRLMATSFSTNVFDWQNLNNITQEFENAKSIPYLSIIKGQYPETDDGSVRILNGRSRTEKIIYNKNNKYIGDAPNVVLYYSGDTYQGFQSGSKVTFRSPYENTTHIMLGWISVVTNIMYTDVALNEDIEQIQHYLVTDKDKMSWLKEIYILSADTTKSYQVIYNPGGPSVALYENTVYKGAGSLNDILSDGMLEIKSGSNIIAYVLIDTSLLPDSNTIHRTVLNYNLQSNPYILSHLTKQEKLVSGTNIKTINGNSILGSGNLNIEAGANVQSDWSQTDTSADDYIKNKPTIPAVQVQSDWNQTDSTSVDFIKNKPTILTKSEIEDDYYNKTQIDSALVNKADSSVLSTINSQLSQLSGGVPSAGAITGNNVWTGSNGFSQPIEGVEGSNSNNVVLLSQLHDAQKAHRIINALDFGFSNTNTAAANTLALQNAVSGGNKTVYITQPGTYMLNDTIELESNTEIVCSKGVILKKDTAYGFVFINKGAATRTFDYNIVLNGISIDADEKDGAPNYEEIDDALWGMRGQISFLCAERIKLLNISITNLGLGMYGIMANNVNHIILDTFYIIGQKDGVHYSKISNFVIKNGIIKTADDNIALNAADWISSNCWCGDIINGRIENIHSLNNRDESWGKGINLVRCLTGAWKDWEQGMSVMRGDFVVNNGKIYRMVIVQTGTTEYTSQTEPTISTFSGKQEDSGGFYWKMMSDVPYYKCEIKNIELLNCKMDGTDSMSALSSDPGSSGYSRTLYPDVEYSEYPICDVIFKNIILNASCDGPICGGNQKLRMTLDNIKFYKQTNISNFADTSLGGLVIFKNCYFDNVPSDVKDINFGSNGTLILNNCRKTLVSGNYSANAYVNMNCYSRLICDFFTNVAVTLSELTPLAGDYVRRLNVPYIYKNGAWVEL